MSVETESRELTFTITRSNGPDERQSYTITAYLGDDSIQGAELSDFTGEAAFEFAARIAEHLSDEGMDEVIPQSVLAQLSQAASRLRSEPVEPPLLIGPEEVLNAIGVQVLGERQDNSIECWVPATGKRQRVRRAGNLRLEDILQMVGSDAGSRIWQDRQKPAPPGYFTVSDVRQALALTASQRPRLSDRNMFGQGVWRHREQLIVVNGGRAWQIADQRIRLIRSPVWRRRVLDLDASGRWTTRLMSEFRTIRDRPERAAEAFSTLTRWLGQWNWRHEADPELAAALVFSTIVQTVWTWRPLVSVIGPSDSGKSTVLNEVIQAVLGDWAIVTDRGTEAGIRQAIGRDARPILMDEFDQYQYRQQVLEFFRTSSRGGRILRGTQDQTGMSFEVRHLPWFFAIETGDIWGQDRNRFLRLELQRPENRGILNLPSRAEREALARPIAAAAIWAASNAVDLADSIRGTVIEGTHGRLVESLSVPAAMAAILSQGEEVSREAAREILMRYADDRQDAGDVGDPDEVNLLREILSATLRVSVQVGDTTSMQPRSVAQILEGELGDDVLETKGVRLVRPRGQGPDEQVLFLAQETVVRELLSQSRWRSSRIDQVLARIPGARRAQQRIGGVRSRGIEIPWAFCLTLMV